MNSLLWLVTGAGMMGDQIGRQTFDHLGASAWSSSYVEAELNGNTYAYDSR